MIEIKHVNKSYGNSKKKIISDINLQVKAGTIHGLIGENSAGKTTLIKCMVGIYDIDGGEILYNGEPIYENGAIKQKVGYVADYNEYIQGYTIKRLVDLYESIYPAFSKEKFEELNSIFKLSPAKNVSHLSKGQKMRLAFMLNIARNTDYLILDEPTSGLDVVAKKQVFDILVSEVESRGLTVLISSHHLSELETLCDAITYIREGKIYLQMSVEEMCKYYTKYQVIYKNGVPDDFYKWKEIMQMQNIGSIYTVIVKDDRAEFRNRCLKSGADFIEEIPVTLEEVFLYTNQGGVIDAI